MQRNFINIISGVEKFSEKFSESFNEIHDFTVEIRCISFPMTVRHNRHDVFTFYTMGISIHWLIITAVNKKLSCC